MKNIFKTVLKIGASFIIGAIGAYFFTKKTDVKVAAKKECNESDIEKAKKLSEIELDKKRAMFEMEQEFRNKRKNECTMKDNGGCAQEPDSAPLPPAKTFAEELEGSDLDNVEGDELLGKFIHAGDICLLCAPTNVGKSVLTTQIGFDLANGLATRLIPDGKAGKALRVFLYDKEGRPIDLVHRYAGMDECILNNKNFLRPPCSGINNLEKLLVDIQGRVRATDGDSIVMVDNITAFTESKSTKSINRFYNGLSLLREEQEKKRLKVTFLLVTHTNKCGVAKSGIRTQDILGSGNLSNLANSILYLEETGVDGERKLRCGKNKFTSDGEGDIILKFVDKPYLHFEYVCHANERGVNESTRSCEEKKNERVCRSEAAGKKKARGKKVTDEEILKMKDLQSNGLAINEIAKQIGRCRKTVGEYLSKGIMTPVTANLVTC